MTFVLAEEVDSMADIPTSIPFLDAAYSPRPQQPDTGGASFMRAREQAEARRERETERAQEEPTRALQRRIAEQSLKKGAIDLEQAILERDAQVESKADFLGMSQLAQGLGSDLNTPDGLASVTEYFIQRPKLLQNPQAIALWEMTAKATDARTRATAALRERGTTDTSAIRNAAYLSTLRKDAEALRQAGDTAAYQAKQAEIADIEGQIKKGQSIRTFDPQGNVTAEITSGGATIATQTMGQKRLIGYEVAVEGIQDVLGKLRPEDVGVRGVIGENVFDTWVEQFVPGTRSTERIENRAALRSISEQLIEAISADTSGRFSDPDVKRLKEITGSVSASKSYGEIKDRLGEINRLVKDRARTYAERTRQPIPDFTRTDEELVTGYETQKAAIQKAYTEKRITKAQAEAELKDAFTTTSAARRRFHGVGAPTPAP